MKVKNAFSTNKEIDLILTDLKNQFGQVNPKLITYFSSPTINPELISSEIKKAFPGSHTMGCTSSGEITSGKMLDGSIVAMALGEYIIDDCWIEVLPGISDSKLEVENAFKNFEKQLGKNMAELDPEKYVGLVLIDGLSGKEEDINERIGDLTNISFIGGSAGDDLSFKKTYVFANGQTITNGAVLALIKSKVPFKTLKTQSFSVTDEIARVNKVDEKSRRVIEINDKPAKAEYARLLGVESSQLADTFFLKPLGLVFGEEIFVRSPQRVEDDSVFFYCGIKEGMELKVLQSHDIIGSTKRALEELIKENGQPSAVINFNCILRTIELKQKDQTSEYGSLFKDFPTIGFSTYGESYIGHINQTATMLAFF